MDDIVIAFAGPIGSGKTTISGTVAKTLDLPRASFGDHVRRVAKQRSLALDRETLQVIGSELIERGWQPFCEAVLSDAGWKKGSGIVIDGLRHTEAINAILKVTGTSKFILIFISIRGQDRQERLITKGIQDKKTQRKIESHSTEVQVASLRHKADLVIDGTQSVSEVVNQIVSFIGRDYHL